MKYTNKYEFPIYEDQDIVELDKYTDDLAEKLERATKNQDTRIDEQLKNMTLEDPSSAEIVDARGEYNLLNDRLNAGDEKTQTNTTDITNIKEELAEELRVHYINRGKNTGDCMLVQAKNKNILIDFGTETDGAKLIEYLVNNNLTKIDYVIISHYHSDHIGGANAQGLIQVVNNTQLDFSSCVFYLPVTPDYSQFIGSDNEEELIKDITPLKHIVQTEETIMQLLTSENIEFKQPENEEILEIDRNTKIRFLNADINAFTNYYNVLEYLSYISKYVTIYNNFSLVAELTHYDNTFLFTGDIEEKAEQEVTKYINKCPNVYKVEHHSVNYITDKEYLKRIYPKIAIVMNTTDTDFNDKTTINHIKDLGIELYTLNESGNMVVTSSMKGIYAETENGVIREGISPINVSKSYRTNSTQDGVVPAYAKLATITFTKPNNTYSGNIMISTSENDGIAGILHFKISTDENNELFKSQFTWLTLNRSIYKDKVLLVQEGTKYSIYIQIDYTWHTYAYTFLNCSFTSRNVSMEIFDREALLYELPEGEIMYPNMADTVDYKIEHNSGKILIGRILIQYGMQEMTPVANTPTKVDMVYPYPYKYAPIIQLTPLSGSIGQDVLGVSAMNVNKNGFELYLTRNSATMTLVYWFAIGEADDTILSL